MGDPKKSRAKYGAALIVLVTLLVWLEADRAARPGDFDFAWALAAFTCPIWGYAIERLLRVAIDRRG